ncbi:MAG: metal-sulfur cluster assembly factor [Leptospirales bacterium]|nr:metal-sulfur cluster assembly factor [Leptospirales bacterium]
MIAERFRNTILFPASDFLQMETSEVTNQLWAEIGTVIDPEIGLSLKELGLIYEVQFNAGKVGVKMTLTSMGCPAGPELTAGVHAACMRVPGVEDAEVEVVWTPKWDPREMASDDAKMTLGIF